MKTIKIKCPAKINLDLKVQNKRPDGFHNIISTMQTISLYDYLTINFSDSEDIKIELSGTSDEIPYDSHNLVYKAAMLYFEKAKISSGTVSVYIEKNIPISAGLAGGSTDAAGVVFGLNKLFNDILTNSELHEICSKLGSDLNFCLEGGRVKTSGRGEILEPFEFEQFNVNLIKPVGLGISAKEAYSTFAQKIMEEDTFSRNDFKNDLEWAILDKHQQLQFIKNHYKTSMMTGSGSTYFSLTEKFEYHDGFWTKNDLKSIDFGVCEV